MQKTLLALFLFCFLSLQSYAQSWEIGGFVGSSGYMGDINPTRPYQFTDAAFGGQVKRNFDGYWSLRLNAMYGKMRGADSLSVDPAQRFRNLDFYSPLGEVSLLAEFNFFKYQASVSKKYSPYLFAGVGGVMFNPKTTYNQVEYSLRMVGTEGQAEAYHPYAVTIPYGAGIKYNIAGNWNLIGEIGYRTAFTDYLDDVSGSYPDPLLLGVPAADLSNRSSLADPTGLQRGDFRKRDTYMFAGVSLTFTFVSRKCYQF